MTIDKNRMELERIYNVVQNFGWELVKQEITDTDLILTVKKKRIDQEVPPEPGAP